MVPTDDGGHILIPAIYGDFVEVSTKPRRRHSCRIGQLTMQSTFIPATICHMGGLQLSGVELNGVLSWVESSGIHATAWNKITCSRSWIMDLDLKIPCHMDGSISGYFLMMDDMSPDYGTAMRVNGRWTLWRSVKMSFRELTKLQEQ